MDHEIRILFFELVLYVKAISRPRSYGRTVEGMRKPCAAERDLSRCCFMLGGPGDVSELNADRLTYGTGRTKGLRALSPTDMPALQASSACAATIDSFAPPDFVKAIILVVLTKIGLKSPTSMINISRGHTHASAGPSRLVSSLLSQGMNHLLRHHKQPICRHS
jgi:hypothetical protein